MVRLGIFDESELSMLRKCVLFYRTVGSTGDFDTEITTAPINALTYTKIRHTLLPVLRKGEKVDLDNMKRTVTAFLDDLLILNNKEKEYLREFDIGNYRPNLLFDDSEIVERIKNHPMAIWKCANKKKS